LSCLGHHGLCSRPHICHFPQALGDEVDVMPGGLLTRRQPGAGEPACLAKVGAFVRACVRGWGWGWGWGCVIMVPSLDVSPPVVAGGSGGWDLAGLALLNHSDHVSQRTTTIRVPGCGGRIVRGVQGWLACATAFRQHDGIGPLREQRPLLSAGHVMQDAPSCSMTEAQPQLWFDRALNADMRACVQGRCCAGLDANALL
jgi:hypothetical protein